MHPEEIKYLLRRGGVTQAMLADELQVAKSTVHQVITGSIKSQRIQTRISEIIGKPIQTLWPDQITLRRSRAQIEEQRARAAL